MSSSTSTSRKEFLCIIPDYPGSVAKRMEVRPKHLEEIMPLVQDGSVVLGGGMFDAHPSEDASEPPSFNGSAMIVLAESAEHVRRVMAADVYARAGVWDVEKASVIPFKSAVREAL
ncbi:YCII domain-containing protein [Aspergillus sp. HF37]|nr:YCII domain-containing protein [Aspergillus sp. HF37]